MGKATEHSAKFEMVQNFYIRAAWSKERVRAAVSKGWITEEEYTEITGENLEE